MTNIRKQIELDTGETIHLIKDTKKITIEIECISHAGDMLYNGLMSLPSLDELNFLFDSKSFVDSLIPIINSHLIGNSPEKEETFVYDKQIEKMYQNEIYDGLKYLFDNISKLKDIIINFNISNGDDFDYMISGYNKSLLDYESTLKDIPNDIVPPNLIGGVINEASTKYTDKFDENDIINIQELEYQIKDSEILSNIKGYITGLYEINQKFLIIFPEIPNIYNKEEFNPDILTKITNALIIRYISNLNLYVNVIGNYFKKYNENANGYTKEFNK